MNRRTQAERSATTRARLLGATLQSLVELGFDGTSTKEICRRAGVSKGAQLHHFPTKAELLVATVEYLCDQRHAEFRQMVHAQPDQTDRVEAAFTQFRRLYASPTMIAWVELAVASRADPVLSAAMQRLSRRLEEDVESTLRAVLQIADGVPAQPIVRMVLSLLDGLALRCMLQDDEAAHEALLVFKTLVSPWLTGARK